VREYVGISAERIIGKGNVLLSLRIRISAATALFNAASDWADTCVIAMGGGVKGALTFDVKMARRISLARAPARR
jgi:hypothetical protein